MKSFEVGKFYFLKVLFFGRELEYECKVLEVGGNRLKIFTEEGDCLWFDLKKIVYSKEIESFEGEPKIVIRKKRVPWNELKKEKGPDIR